MCYSCLVVERVKQNSLLMQHINTIEMKLKGIAIQYINTVKKVYESNILAWIKCTTSLIKHIDTIERK
jgi:hypothetical protein